MATAHSVFIRVRLLIKNLRRIRKAQTTMKGYAWQRALTNVVFYAWHKFFSPAFLKFVEDPLVQFAYLAPFRIFRSMREVEIVTCFQLDIE